MNFSPFFAGSEGLVTPAGLAPAFSGPGVAAHDISEPKKSETEMMRPMRAVFINFDFIVLPKFKDLFRPLKMRRKFTSSKFKQVYMFWILHAGRM
jgi:hypothetical protein